MLISDSESSELSNERSRTWNQYAAQKSNAPFVPAAEASLDPQDPPDCSLA